MERETAKRMSDGKWLVCDENGDTRRVDTLHEAKVLLGIDSPGDAD